MTEIRRYRSTDDLARGASSALLRALEGERRSQRPLQLCLAGGHTADLLYSCLAEQAGQSTLRSGDLELWWSAENFVPTDAPERHAGVNLARLAAHFPLEAALTHPMPSADGVADNAASAATYAEELGDTIFDICLLGLGADGHVAAVFPGHPSFEPTSHTVIAVNDAPQPPSKRITLTVPALCRSREVWFLVGGAEKAAILPRVMAGDPALPGGAVRGTERTVWFVDDDAAAHVPYYDCAF